MMGKASRLRRQAFFAQHPFCCFCGGGVPATEIDHLSARHLFRGRLWPEGYEFPACALCNRGAAIDELLMGFLIRIRLTDLSPAEEAELEAAISKAHDRHPEIFANMKELSRIETTRFIRSCGTTREHIPPEPYVIEFPQQITEVTRRYGEKLGKGLYYMHMGRILPKDGGVSATPFTNTRFHSSNFPIEQFSVLREKPILSRSKVSLEDQFSYRYAVADDGEIAAFLVQFGESMGMLLLAYENALRYAKAREASSASKEG